MDGLDTSETHTITIEWDTVKNDKHAIDYLTTYNRTETDANPCSDVSDCDLSSYDTETIPSDPNAVNQISGVFTLFGGNITGLSGYSVDVDPQVTTTGITITFTTTVPNPVLAWGGHISTQQDWGVGNSAI